MKRKKQLSIFDQIPKRGPKLKKPHDHFGGSYFKNYNPKTKRPLDSKKALHVVMRSSLARGPRSFKNKIYDAKIWDIVREHAKRNGVRIYEYANSGNHLHLLIRSKSRDAYNRFIRTISGLIARLVGRSERGKPLGKKFWDARPFSRVVSFAKKEFELAKAYLLRNTLETLGLMAYYPRNKKLPRHIQAWLCPNLE